MVNASLTARFPGREAHNAKKPGAGPGFSVRSGGSLASRRRASGS